MNPSSKTNDEELEELLLDFADHLKGVTVYREGSRGEEPLTRVSTSSMDVEEMLKIAKKYTVNVECENGTCEI